MNSLIEMLCNLLTDEDLPEKYRDHTLIGDCEGYRECHIKPDLLLIYKQANDHTFCLARLGSHSKLIHNI